MNTKSQCASSRPLRPAALLLMTLAMAGCNQGNPSKPKSEKPAKVEAHPSEVDIYRIVLTPKAETRLQISTVPVERQSITRHRSLGGPLRQLAGCDAWSNGTVGRGIARGK